MAEFKVSPEKLRTTSVNLKKVNTEFNQIMGEISADMKKTRQRWDSETANSFIRKFEALSPKFDEYSKVIQSYSNFLEKTAQSYSKTESTLNSATENLFA